MNVPSFSRLVLRALSFGSLTLAGCAHSPSPAEQGLAAAPEPSPAAEVAPSETEKAAPTTGIVVDSGPAKRPEQRCESLLGGEQRIKRSAVVEVISAGLGKWLQGVHIERVLEGRKFAGWRILSLHLENPCYAAVDLRPGDIVTAVNGQGPKNLERPDSAQLLFDGLKKATAIEVAFSRENKPRVIRFEIAETPSQ
jgi:hypothetical protein